MNRITFNKWKNATLLLTSIGIANIGAWIYLIALNLIIFDMTSSPFAVTILYILKPLATLFTNFWAGSFIDRINKRNLMIGLDIFRAIFLYILPLVSHLWFIYLIVFFINMASSIFYPTSMIYITKLVPSENRQRFNSFRSLISSGAFILGPSIAGILFMIGSPTYAIYINGASLFISGLLTFYLPNIEKNEMSVSPNEKFTFKILKSDWQVVIKYWRDHLKVMSIVFLFNLILVMTAAIDSLEAVFSKEVLSLSNSKYGFLVSIAGAGFIIGSFINSIFVNKLNIMKMIGYGSFIVSIGYVIYAYSNVFLYAAIGFFILSFALALANTGFDTYYQNFIPVEIMGRIGSVVGLIHACFVIFFTTMIGYLTNLFPTQVIVIIASIFMLLIATVLLISIEYFNRNELTAHNKRKISFE